jgi:queuosine precursor transporter
MARAGRSVGLAAVTSLQQLRPTVATGPSYVRHPTGIYTVVVALFCGLLLISNIAATKLITVVDGLPVIQGIFTDGGAFLFPLTYILGDVLAEVYGLRQARRAIWLGFFLAALASLTFLVVGMAPPGPGYENQDAFLAVLGFVPRIVVASLAGYLAGQFLNAYVLVRIKNRTNERKLWVRLVGSTVVGELADTALFCVIAFVGVIQGWGALVSYTIVGYLYKVTVEIVFLPVTYAVIRAIKRREPDYAGAGLDRPAVSQLRLVVRADDYQGALRFYRDALGMREEETHRTGDARVSILDAGRATLEISDPAQVDYIDTVEVGRTGVSPPWRVAVEVDDATATTARLQSAGAAVIAPPTQTPWRSVNSRLQAPAGVQLTVFEELEKDRDR